MEEVLERLTKGLEKPKSYEIIKLLTTYVNNIVGNPSNPKFRRIRISNPKFHSVIWSVEDARSLLLLAGFEEADGFLVLPEGICLDAVKIILDHVNVDDDAPLPPQENIPQETAPLTSANLLTLRSPADNSMFDESMKADMTLLSYMKEMGFDVTIAKKALIITKNQGIQPAMDWIANNPTKVNEIRMAALQKANIEMEPDRSKKEQTIVNDTHSTTQSSPVSRYQATIDERHRFQEKLRLEAIEAARIEKANQKRQKEYLLKNLEDEKKERIEKGQWTKHMRMTENENSRVGTAKETSNTFSAETEKNDIFLKLRLPDGQVNTLRLQAKSPLSRIYKHVMEISSLQEDDFTLMVVSPQQKLVDKDKTLEELGLESHVTLIVQRCDQTGNLAQGQGEFFQILEIDTVKQFETTLWKNSNKLIVTQFYTMPTVADEHLAKEFEDLSAEYGVHKKAIFLKVNIDLLPALKENYSMEIFPTYKLTWNRETLCDIEGYDKDRLEKAIKENIDRPVGEKVADNTSGDFFDPR